jgi:hypothetical protein
MNSKSTAALLLAGLLVAGLSASQAAFAHNFTEDESATFLVKVDAIKVHMTLVGRNLGDAEAAVAHVEHAAMQLDEQTLAELAERNERLAADIPAAFDELSSMIQSGATKPEVAQQIRSISDLLAEAVSARIDAESLSDPAVRALVVAGLVDNALQSYEAAHGVGGEHGSMDMGENGSTDMGGNQTSGGIVDEDSYVASKLFSFRAKSVFHMVASEAESQDDAATVWSNLVELRDAISSRSSWEDVTIIVHTKVQENLAGAFGLEVAGHTGSEDEGSMEEGHMG